MGKSAVLQRAMTRILVIRCTSPRIPDKRSNAQGIAMEGPRARLYEYSFQFFLDDRYLLSLDCGLGDP